jgi:5'-deoxynucleotidase YfbR-like HD superfamily hydrolase
MAQSNIPEPVRHDWFITASGRQLFALDPDPAQICIEDIAHALSNICRFSGHTREFVSVAQHCVLVSRLVPHEHARAALLHDAPEAYLGDVIRPIKRVLGINYTRLELAWWLAITKRFGVNPTLPDCVKDADNIALMTERRDLIPSHAFKWVEDEHGYKPHPERVIPMTPCEARAAFLARFEEL